MRITDLLALSPLLGFTEINQRREDVVRQLTAARTAREKLLLVDGSEADIARCDREADEAHLILERLEAAENQLRARQSGVSALNFRNTLR
ncbi:MAG: hypothetical protein ABSC06_26420 [Rhodopila sp.]|jgi:hypothetical protein